jgi:integrase
MPPSTIPTVRKKEWPDMATKRTSTRTKTPGVYKIVSTTARGTSTRYEVLLRIGPETTGKDGKSRRKLMNEGRYATYEEARAVAESIRHAHRHGGYAPLSAAQATFGDVADLWLQGRINAGRRPSTIAGYRAMLKNGNGRLAPLTALQLKHVTYERISRLLADWDQEGLSRSTQHNLFTIIKGVMDEAVKRNLIAINPCHKVDRPTVEMGDTYELHHAEVEALIEECTKAGEVWGLLVETAAYSGLRAGELAGLRVRYVDTTTGTIRVEEAVVSASGVLTPGRPKSKAGRRVVTELPPSLCTRLASYIAAEMLRSDDYLFGWFDAEGTSRPYRHSNFYRRIWQPACRTVGQRLNSGLASARFHDLRHFHAANLLADPGTSWKDAQAQMGHGTLMLLADRYAHLLPGSGTGRADRVEAARAQARATATQETAEVIPFPTQNAG